ncbi:acyl-CoA thioesterase [Alicyclobacillus fastidiosus]|uniref:Acyl-CoA thioesterase n=1 Tax=Alicyclobacillus fastidiosus TaxID=392011 RepID=A0ABY6ZMT6_9BACL|nr:acyl-CoA thioesterase [Alicyclobacillus fastidiosus]WAH43280.1 acyl-CoA thioesterase [Alicyclobacillus fastidiosus]
MSQEAKYCNESRVVKTSHVFPPDTNVHNTLFGGRLMGYIDDCASLSATRHARYPVVTASTDSVDFLSPISMSDSVCLESYVTWTGRSSMEVFVKVIAENLMTGERRIAATSFLTFVALDKEKHPVVVPQVIPQTDEEKKLHETAPARAVLRKDRREESRKLAEFLTTNKPW